MNKKNNLVSYLGLLMILMGSVFLLELNGILPKTFLQEIVNIGIGLCILAMYFKDRKFYLLMLSIFFITNGCVHLMDTLLIGSNYWVAIFLIPGMMLIAAYLVQKRKPYLIPGSLLFFWGIYGIFISVGLWMNFTSVMGMFFICTALAFMVIAWTLREGWALIPTIVLGVFGLFVFIAGLGPFARNLLLQVIAIGIILAGVFLIMGQMVRANKIKKLQQQQNNDAEDDL